MSTIIDKCNNISNPITVFSNQASGFLGARAVADLGISSGVNPLAAGAANAAFEATIRLLANFVPMVKFKEINLTRILVTGAGLAAGAKLYAATSALSSRELLKINGAILLSSIAINLVLGPKQEKKQSPTPPVRTTIHQCQIIAHPINVITNQASGFLGARAVADLGILAGVNSLAAGAAFAASGATVRIFGSFVPQVKFKGIDLTRILAGTASLVAGVKMYTATSALSTVELRKINAGILLSSLAINLLLGFAAPEKVTKK